MWLEDLKVPEEEPEDPCNIVRTEDNFVGLTNLGATCYINSLLQLWFHNPDFRKAIYSWVPWFDPSEKENKTVELLDKGGFIPNSPIGKLQVLFALMQFSRRRCISKNYFHLFTIFNSCIVCLIAVSTLLLSLPHLGLISPHSKMPRSSQNFS